MAVDYTRYFRTEDELVKFLNLSNEKQDEYLGIFIAGDVEAAKEVYCNIMNRPEKDIDEIRSK